MDKLSNWPEILDYFRRLMLKATSVNSSQDVEERGSTPVRILRMICRNQSLSRYAAIEGNVLHAAMHLACLKELPCSREDFPDIPHNMDNFLKS